MRGPCHGTGYVLLVKSLIMRNVISLNVLFGLSLVALRKCLLSPLCRCNKGNSLCWR
jgi:hypothetical protein